MVLFADGDSVEQLVGVQNEANLRQLIERYA
jgi:thioredoxin-like negative regulator of GroEL